MYNYNWKQRTYTRINIRSREGAAAPYYEYRNTEQEYCGFDPAGGLRGPVVKAASNPMRGSCQLQTLSERLNEMQTIGEFELRTN